MLYTHTDKKKVFQSFFIFDIVIYFLKKIFFKVHVEKTKTKQNKKNKNKNELIFNNKHLNIRRHSSLIIVAEFKMLNFRCYSFLYHSNHLKNIFVCCSFNNFNDRKICQ